MEMIKKLSYNIQANHDLIVNRNENNKIYAIIMYLNGVLNGVLILYV